MQACSGSLKQFRRTLGQHIAACERELKAHGDGLLSGGRRRQTGENLESMLMICKGKRI